MEFACACGEDYLHLLCSDDYITVSSGLNGSEVLDANAVRKGAYSLDFLLGLDRSDAEALRDFLKAWLTTQKQPPVKLGDF